MLRSYKDPRTLRPLLWRRRKYWAKNMFGDEEGGGSWSHTQYPVGGAAKCQGHRWREKQEDNKTLSVSVHSSSSTDVLLCHAIDVGSLM